MRPGNENASASIAAEFQALRSAAGLSSLDERALLTVRGEDRASFLQGMLSNDIAGCAPGQGVYALLLTEQGRVVADLRAFALEREIWLDVPRGALDATCAALERLIVADDVELERASTCGLALRGPGASAVLAAAVGGGGDAVAGLTEGAHQEIEVGDVRARVARVRDIGIDGFHIWLPEAVRREACHAQLRRAGAVPVSAEAAELQRVAAGWAKQGVDFDEHTLAPEVPSLARAISYSKGCYLGQELVERVAARGHVNWLVVGLRAERSTPALVVGAAVSHEGREVGHVSSVAALPDGSEAVALARIRRAAAEPGTLVAVGGEGGGEVRVFSIPVES